MFVVDRSALAVLAPLLLLAAVVWWSNRTGAAPPQAGVPQQAREAPARAQTVAANLPSR